MVNGKSGRPLKPFTLRVDGGSYRIVEFGQVTGSVPRRKLRELLIRYRYIRRMVDSAEVSFINGGGDSDSSRREDLLDLKGGGVI